VERDKFGEIKGDPFAHIPKNNIMNRFSDKEFGIENLLDAQKDILAFLQGAGANTDTLQNNDFLVTLDDIRKKLGPKDKKLTALLWFS
jgi:hypothetical protein